jgi:hypothetical protein
MSEEESEKFNKLLAEDLTKRSENAKKIEKKIIDADEYEIIKLY